MSHTVSPCNGLKKCFRHPTGCAKIVTTSREDWLLRQKRKAKRKRLWNKVLQDYKISAKWGLNPILREYHLKVVLLLDELLGEEELSENIRKSNLQSASK